jgi:DNA repair ATPase RecN
MDDIEISFGTLEEKVKVGLEEIKKNQELTMKRTEISEFMLKKFEIIQNTLEQNEKKIMGAIDKRMEDMGLEADNRLNEIVNSIDETGSLVKEVTEKITANVESLEKLEDEMLTMMKALNEQAIKLQNVQWMHDELMTIKKRELQIINLLKNQDNVETEFLEQMCS